MTSHTRGAKGSRKAHMDSPCSFVLTMARSPSLVMGKEKRANSLRLVLTEMSAKAALARGEERKVVRGRATKAAVGCAT